MRITVLATNSVPKLGGVAEYLHGLMSATTDDIQWTLRTIVPGDAEQDDLLPYRVIRFAPEVPLRESMRFDGILPLRKLNTLRWFHAKRNSTLALINRIIREDSPDAILIARWEQESNWWCRCCRIAGIPYIIIAYGLEMINRLSRFYVRGRIEDLKGASLVFADSRCVKGIVDEMSEGIPPVRVLNPGIDPDRMNLLPETEVASITRSLGIEGRYVLSMGRLTYRKGFDLAARAFASVAEEYPDVSLVIAGSGDYQEEIERTVADTGLSERIIMPGRISDRQKMALFQNCEYFVMANRPVENDIEGFGIVFLEANHCGKAVIGGNNGGVPDAIVHEKTGLLVDTPDVGLLAEAMQRLLDDVELRRSMGRYGRSRTKEEFSWSQLSGIFLEAVGRYL